MSELQTRRIEVDRPEPDSPEAQKVIKAIQDIQRLTTWERLCVMAPQDLTEDERGLFIKLLFKQGPVKKDDAERDDAVTESLNAKLAATTRGVRTAIKTVTIADEPHLDLINTGIRELSAWEGDALDMQYEVLDAAKRTRSPLVRELLVCFLGAGQGVTRNKISPRLNEHSVFSKGYGIGYGNFFSNGIDGIGKLVSNTNAGILASTDLEITQRGGRFIPARKSAAGVQAYVINPLLQS